MARFTVRVELHDADEDDYERLHERMARGGFGREIAGSNGKTYRLPPAEYELQSSDTIEQVRDNARDIAKKVRSNAAVLVTQGQKAWSGLEEAK